MSAAIGLFVLIGIAGASSLAQPPADELDMSVKELMQLEVSSVARKQQTLARSAAAVFVITREEIRRSGYRTVPEILRMAPGLHVAQVGSHTWSITARGFSGVFANRMLVLVDGRSIYTPHYAGVYWEMHDLMVEDIERIEVIRGPGATMWGANAVNGVINIITRHARSTRGGLVAAGAGTGEQAFSSVRYGGALSEKLWYRVYGKYANYRSSVLEQGGDAGDGWSDARGGLRLDYEPSPRDALTLVTGVSTGFFRETTQLPGAAPPYLEQRPVSYQTSTQDLLLRWRHTHRNGSETQAQIYFDGYDRPHPVYGERRLTVDAEVQNRFRVGSHHEWTWGGGYRYSADRSGAGHVRVTPETFALDLYTAFAQDEVQFFDDLVNVTLGAKVQHTAYSGVTLQPTFRVLAEPFGGHVFWGAVSRAVRLPSRLERDSDSWVATYADQAQTQGIPVRVLLRGSERLRSFPMVAFEGGYRADLTSRITFDLTAFQHRYSRLRSLEMGQPAIAFSPQLSVTMPMTFSDGLEGVSRGLETLAQIRLTPRWTLIGSYTLLTSSLTLRPGATGARGENTFQPESIGSIRSQLDLPGRFQLDAGWYGASAIRIERTLLDSPLKYNPPGAWSRLDLKVSWPIRPNLELSIRSNGMLEERHLEMRPEAFIPSAEIRRAVGATLVWQF